jgi:hypothetical protein
MGVDVTIEKGDVGICLGRLNCVIPTGFNGTINANDKSFWEEVIRMIDEENVELSGDLMVLCAYTPKDVEDLNAIKEEFRSKMEELNTNFMRRSYIFVIMDALDEQFTVTVA